MTGPGAPTKTEAAPAPDAAAARASSTTPHAPRAGASPRAWITMLAVALLALTADLVTKSWAFRTVAGRPVEVVREEVLAIAKVDPTQIGRVIPPHPPVVVVPHALEFTLVLNSGAVFGMGPGQRWFFMAFTGAALVFAGVLFARWCSARDRASHAAIGLLVSGGVGNFYDRMVFGCVRDFIHPLPGVKWPFGWKPLGGSGELWPYVSNVADAFLLVGIAVLAWRMWRAEPTPPAKSTGDA